MRHDDDPLIRLMRPLMGVLAATFVNVIVAALVGGAMPFEYAGRAWTYTGLVLYVIVGAVVVFRLTAEGEREFSAARVFKWALSIWLWPALLAVSRGFKRDRP
jgi:putative Ca2+/H+ antiporter (TMEM165/GDT1 family)